MLQPPAKNLAAVELVSSGSLPTSESAFDPARIRRCFADLELRVECGGEEAGLGPSPLFEEGRQL